MGGGAFLRASAPGQPILNTPRMSPESYRHLRSIYKDRLQTMFPGAKLETLVEAPEKKDYGDMDFVIALDQAPVWQDVADHIGARGYIVAFERRCTLGVPIDGSKCGDVAREYSHVHDNQASNKSRKTAHSATASTSASRQSVTETPMTEPSTEQTYAQIDIEIVAPAMFDWYMMYGSYGDMARLLGHMLHSLGFTVSDRGLELRLKELDDAKTLAYVNIADKDGKLLLSHNPAEVLKFLGLSVDAYSQGFGTLQELYAWLAKCRLLRMDAVKLKRFTSSERQLENKRTVYAGFFNEWLPAHRSEEASRPDEQDPNLPSEPSEDLIQFRADLADEAVNTFNVRPKYEHMRNLLVRTIDSATAGHLLKPILEEVSGKKDVSEILRAFRRCVGVDEEGQMYILQPAGAHGDAESELWKLLEDDRKTLRAQAEVRGFVITNWEHVKEVERKRAKEARTREYGVGIHFPHLVSRTD